MTDPLSLLLAGRRILLGVTGGIAAYKAADLTRRLREAGADVQVVMTAHATEFVAPLTFQALSGREVRGALFDTAHEAAMGHIELARWADLILIAPATANVLAKLAQGSADDLLSTLCLATDRPVALAPAMNRLMWGHPATQANVSSLRARGVHILGPGSGSQACGETGDGRMLEPLELRDAVVSLLGQGPLAGRHAVVTAGPTREPIDPVRYLSNRSSGKMGYALAAALAGLGARVTLVSGPTALSCPGGVQRVDVQTAAQMLEAALAHARTADLFIGCAAVADYRAETVAGHKIKKKAADLSLPLARTEDVLARVREAFPQLFVAGFAAETEELERHAREKLARKRLNLIAANWVHEGRAFEQDCNELHVYWPEGAAHIAEAPKTEVARSLARLIADHFHAHSSART